MLLLFPEMMKMETKYYQIDEVAKMTGLTKRTIRYYEDLELVAPARSDSSYRLYTMEDVDAINEVKNLRSKLALNLEQVKRFLGLRKSIEMIMNDEIVDIDAIKDAEDKIREIMELIDEREAVLNRIKDNCSNHLRNLDMKAENLEAKNEKR
jgi:DNA-binding transcriptional MerR regulator